MEKDLSNAYQSSLIYVALEPCSAVYFLPNYLGGQFGESPSQWKSAVVEFLIRNLLANLIKPDSPEFHHLNAEEICKIYSDSKPEISTEIWMGVQFNSTKLLDELLKNEGLYSWDKFNSPTNEEFIQMLNSLYIG